MCTFAKHLKELTKVKASRTATINICGLGDKTPELITFMEKTNVDILGIADMKEGKNMQEVLERYIIL